MKFLSKISALSLAFLVLLSTLSFTVDQHYCGDFLVDISFFGDADGCGMEISKAAKKNCCSDEKLSFDGQDELQFQFVSIKSFSTPDFTITHHFDWMPSKTLYSEGSIYYKEFPPPDIPKNFQAEYQVFII